MDIFENFSVLFFEVWDKGILGVDIFQILIGLGIFLITFLGYLFYSQPLQWQSIIGLIFIAIGVAIVNIFKDQSAI